MILRSHLPLSFRRFDPARDLDWARSLPHEADPAGPFEDGDYCSLIAVADGRDVAICTWVVAEPIEEGTVGIHRLWVEPVFRRQGVGRELLEQVTRRVQRDFAAEGSRLRRVVVPGGLSLFGGDNFLRSMGYNRLKNQAEGVWVRRWATEEAG